MVSEKIIQVERIGLRDLADISALAAKDLFPNLLARFRLSKALFVPHAERVVRSTVSHRLLDESRAGWTGRRLDDVKRCKWQSARNQVMLMIVRAPAGTDGWPLPHSN